MRIVNAVTSCLPRGTTRCKICPPVAAAHSGNPLVPGPSDTRWLSRPAPASGGARDGERSGIKPLDDRAPPRLADRPKLITRQTTRDNLPVRIEHAEQRSSGMAQLRHRGQHCNAVEAQRPSSAGRVRWQQGFTGRFRHSIAPPSRSSYSSVPSHRSVSSTADQPEEPVSTPDDQTACAARPWRAPACAAAQW